MKKFILYITLIVVSVIITSCAGYIRGKVSSALYSNVPEGGTFAVLEPKSVNLTEKNIQKNIIEQMELKNFNHTTELENADIIVNYSYSIGAGRTSVSSSPDYVMGGTKVSSSTSYPRYFQISLIDVKVTKLKNKPVIYWQGEVYSSGSGSNISFLSAYFIDEIFANFGETVDNKGFSKITE